MSADPRDAGLLTTLLAEAAGPVGPEHPDEDTLLGYLAGEHADDVDARIQDHLTACRRCVQVLLDLEPFARAAAEPRPAVADLAAAPPGGSSAPGSARAGRGAAARRGRSSPSPPRWRWRSSACPSGWRSSRGAIAISAAR